MVGVESRTVRKCGSEFTRQRAHDVEFKQTPWTGAFVGAVVVFCLTGAFVGALVIFALIGAVVGALVIFTLTGAFVGALVLGSAQEHPSKPKGP